MMNPEKKMLVLKILCMVLAELPFLLFIAVMYPEWTGYRINRFDPVYLLLAVIVETVLVWRRYQEGVSSDRYGLTIALPAFAVMMCGYWTGFPAAASAASVFFAGGMMWVIFGWRLFYRLFPVPLLALLALPTTWFQVFLPGISYRWKITLATALILYAMFALLTDFNPIRRRTAFFAAGVVLFAIAYAMR